MKKNGLRFTWIKLENWRNFQEAKADLGRRVFLIGPNASGKSNFLDAFRFLRDIVGVGGGLQEAVRRRGGVSMLRCLSARKRSQVAITVRLGDDSNPNLWEYEIAFSADKELIIKKERVAHKGVEILLRPNKDDEFDPQRLTQTYLEQVNMNRDFREIADFFSSIRYLHIVPQLVREPDRSIGRANDPYGGDFLEQLASVQKKTLKSRLKRIVEALRVAVPQLEELELVRDRKGTPHLRGKFANWRAQGVWLNEDQFSDGTLRLFGLLWSLLDGNSPLLLEEPELSLHPEVVRHIPQMMARLQRTTKRQIIISTHSSELLQDDGIGMDEILLLQPGKEGTKVVSPSDFAEVKTLVEGGMSVGDAVFPLTRPDRVEQLALFGDEK